MPARKPTKSAKPAMPASPVKAAKAAKPTKPAKPAKPTTTPRTNSKSARKPSRDSGKKPAATSKGGKAPAPAALGPYVRPNGETVSALEAYPYPGGGIVGLVVTNGPKSHRSELVASLDWDAQDVEEVTSRGRDGIATIARSGDGHFYAARDGGVLERGTFATLSALTEAGNLDFHVTKLSPAARGVYVLGQRQNDHVVGHFDGKRFTELEHPGAKLWAISEARDGTVYACGEGGALFRHGKSGWQTISCSFTSSLFDVLAIDAKRAYIAGAGGVGGRIDGTTVTLYEPRDRRDYYAVALYKDRLYVGADTLGIDRVEEDRLVPHKENVFASFLHADDSYLIATGRNELIRHDGSTWGATTFE